MREIKGLIGDVENAMATAIYYADEYFKLQGGEYADIGCEFRRQSMAALRIADALHRCALNLVQRMRIKHGELAEDMRQTFESHVVWFAAAKKELEERLCTIS